MPLEVTVVAHRPVLSTTLTVPFLTDPHFAFNTVDVARHRTSSPVAHTARCVPTSPFAHNAVTDEEFLEYTVHPVRIKPFSSCSSLTDVSRASRRYWSKGRGLPR